MNPILLRTTVAMLVAFCGGALGVVLGRIAPHHLKRLVYAAMVVLVAITFFDILPDAKALLSWPAFLLATASGYGLFWMIGKYVYHLCPACTLNVFDSAATQRLGQSLVLLLIALGIHSTMDGIAVAVGDKISAQADWKLLFAISFHKLPEGLTLALLLLGAGYTRRAAFLWTVGIEATTGLGGLIGVYALHDVSLPWLGLLFAHVGGGFLYLIGNTIGIFVRPRLSQTARSHETSLRKPL